MNEHAPANDDQIGTDASKPTLSADPDRELAVALTLNSGVGTPFGDLRIVRIGTTALRCAEER